jgi:glutamate synthase domain-containing protein 1
LLLRNGTCAIICYINKSGRPSHGNVQRTIAALIKMGHRAGEINGEGLPEFWFFTRD